MNSNASISKFTVLFFLLLAALFDTIFLLAIFPLLKILLRPELFVWALIFTGISLLIVNATMIAAPYITRKITLSIFVALSTWIGIYFFAQSFFTFAFYYIVSKKIYVIASLSILFIFLCVLYPIIYLNAKASKWGKSNNQ